MTATSNQSIERRAVRHGNGERPEIRRGERRARTSEVGPYVTSYPRWMQEMASVIGDRPLRKIAIPGTHDSGTYDLYTLFGPEIAPDAPPFTKYLPDDIVVPVIRAWAQTQDRTVRQQLDAGIRMLDLRVCRRKWLWGYDDDDVRIIHSLYGPKIFDVLEDVRDFMAANPKEIVILTFGTNGVADAMSDESNRRLCERIEALFGDGSGLGNVLVPRNYGVNVTPNQLWARNPSPRLIVAFGYGDWAQFSTRPWAWNKDDSFWDGTGIGVDGVQDVDSLKKGLNKAYTTTPPEDKFSTTSCCLTADQNMIESYLLTGSLLKNCAVPAAAGADWYRYYWHDAGVNVFKFDFFDITSQVDVALAINRGPDPATWLYNGANNGEARKWDGIYLDTTPLTAPPNSTVVGMRWVFTDTDSRYQARNRLAPVLYCRTADNTLVTVTNYANNSNCFKIDDKLYVDSTQLEAPPGYRINGFQLRRSSGSDGYGTDNRLVPVLQCVPRAGGTQITVTNKANNDSYFAWKNNPYADTTPLIAPSGASMIGFAFRRSAYGDFNTNNRIAPTIGYAFPPGPAEVDR